LRIMSSSYKNGFDKSLCKDLCQTKKAPNIRGFIETIYVKTAYR